MTNIDGTICSGTVADKEVYFFVVNKADEIQKHHASGKFYEIEELDIITQFVPEEAYSLTSEQMSATTLFTSAIFCIRRRLLS